MGTEARPAAPLHAVAWLLQVPLGFRSHECVPVPTRPAWLRAVTTVNPVSHVVSAMRDLMITGAITSNVGWALLGCVAVVAIFVPLAVRSYTKRV